MRILANVVTPWRMLDFNSSKMKKIYSFLFSESLLVKGSFIVLFGSILTNVGSYIFHLMMGRWLGPADYGVLESLVSVLTLLSIPLGVLNIIIVKYVSIKHNNIKIDNKNSDNNFIKLIIDKVSIYGLIILLLFLCLFPITKNVLKINSFYLILAVGITFYFNLYSSVFSSVLQGKMEFLRFSCLGVFGSWSKLIFGVILVYFGFKVGGPITAFALSSIFTFATGYFLLNKTTGFNLFSKEKSKMTVRGLFTGVEKYSLAVLLSSLSLTSLISADIILARFFLSPLEAGHYAALSVLGKIIFFASSPIISVMFPMISNKESQGKDYRLLLAASFFMVLIISILISSVFYLFPSGMSTALFGLKYSGISNSLGNFAIFISLYGLCYLLVNFYLSISKKIIVIFPVVFSIVQILLIVMFHKDIAQIVFINILVHSVFLIVLLFYLLRDINNKKLNNKNIFKFKIS